VKKLLTLSIILVLMGWAGYKKNREYCWDCRYTVLYVTGDTLGYNDYVMCDVTEEHMEKSLIEINAQDPNQITVCTKQ
jgi:hypothetical protein